MMLLQKTWQIFTWFMNWIQHPLELVGDRVTLSPLNDSYYDQLADAAADKRIWEHMAIHGWERDELLPALKAAVLRRMSGEEYPFIVKDNATGNIIGSTRYMDMQPQFRKLEIGWTWYAPLYWGTGHNTECKLLLLTYAFETLQCVRVQLTARDENTRSRAAIEKIGGKFEGILRNHLIRFGQVRNTAMYSITNCDWPEIKDMLAQKVSK